MRICSLFKKKNTNGMINAFKKVRITFCLLRQYSFYLVLSIFNYMIFHIIFIVLEFPSLLILASLIEKKSFEFLKLSPIIHTQLPWTRSLFLVYLTSHINGNRAPFGRSWIPFSLPPCPIQGAPVNTCLFSCYIIWQVNCSGY